MKSIRMIFMLFLVAGAAAACRAHTAQMVGTQGWCAYSNPDFTILSQKSESDTAAWAARLNQFLHAMRGRLPEDPRLLGPLTIILFNDRYDFWDSVPVLKSGEPPLDLGAFSRTGGWGAIMGASDRESDELTQRILFQGGVGWLLSGDHRPIPRALRLGLKLVYGAYVTQGDSEIFGQPPRGIISRLQRAVDHPLASNGRFLKVEDLLSVGEVDSVADRHGLALFQMESWGFTHFLLFSKDMANKGSMARLLDAFGRKATPHEALREAFGDEADSIDTLFYNYIRGGDFYEVTRPIEPAPLVGAPHPADPAFVSSVLGRLEVIANHPDVARAYVEEAISLAPNDPGPREVLALVDYKTGSHAAAAADCDDAIRLGSRDGWTWEEASEEIAGVTRWGMPPDTTPEKAREAVNLSERAILYCRGLQRAYEFVAKLIPLADHVTEDDGKFLTLGQKLLPGDGWIAVGRAQWARRVHDDGLALQILGDVLSHSDLMPPAVVEKARALQAQWLGSPG